MSAASDRIAADIDALLERFAVDGGDSVPGWLPPAAPASPLAAVPMTDRSGVAAVSESGPASPRSPELPPWEQDGWVDGGGAEDPGNPAQAPGLLWPDADPKTGNDPASATGLDGPANGRAGGSGDWQPWQATGAPTKPASTARRSPARAASHQSHPRGRSPDRQGWSP